MSDDNSDPLPLEQILSTRLKTLESELADCRRSLHESQQSEARSTETIATLRKSTEAANILIAQLEVDLEHQTNVVSSGNRRGKALQMNDTTVMDKSSSLPRPFNNGKAALREGTTYNQGHPNHPDSGGSMELSELLGVDLIGSKTVDETSNSTGMVAILQSQRDRYKERLGQAELAITETKQQLQAAQTAKQQLEADNLALYEKIRYLQSYGSSLQKGGKVRASDLLVAVSLFLLAYRAAEAYMWIRLQWTQ
jgi:homeobox protein cut-like